MRLDGEFDVEDSPMFWLPQYHVRFSPPHCFVLLLNCNSTVHCTTMQKRNGFLGVAFVQKRNQIVSLKKAITNPDGKEGIPYFKAKSRYENLQVSALMDVLVYFCAL